MHRSTSEMGTEPSRAASDDGLLAAQLRFVQEPIARVSFAWAIIIGVSAGPGLVVGLVSGQWWALVPAGYVFLLVLVVPGLIAIGSLAHRRRLTGVRLGIVIAVISVSPSIIALYHAAAEPLTLTLFLYDLGPLFWMAGIILSSLTLRPWVPVTVGVVCGAQYVGLFALAQPTLASLSGPPDLVVVLTHIVPAARRGLVFLGVGAAAALVTSSFMAIVRGALADQRLVQDQRVRLVAAEAAETAARIAEETKSTFVATMSHELRTPLHAVLGHTKLLLDRGSLDRDVRAKLELIERSGRHLLGLVEDGLDHAALEAGKLTLYPDALDLVHLIEEVAALYAPALHDRPIELVWSVAEGTPAEVVLDGRRLRQVLINLVGNAVKFTRSGEIGLHVSMMGPKLCLRVSDTGAGIDDINAIFEPFTQGGTASDRAQGSGLGLNISRKIVVAMGGSLEVTTEPGVGSTFSVGLPVTAVAGHETAARGARLGTARAHWNLPSMSVREELAELAHLGDMKGILVVVDRLADDPEQAAFSEHLRGLARAFDDVSILALVDPDAAPS